MVGFVPDCVICEYEARELADDGAAEFGIAQSTVSQIVNGQRWTDD